MSWTGKTNRHGRGRGGGPKVTVTDVGCAGRVPLGKCGASAISWQEKGTAGRKPTASGRTRQDAARGTVVAQEGTVRGHARHRRAPSGDTHGGRGVLCHSGSVVLAPRGRAVPRGAPRTGQRRERLQRARAKAGPGCAGDAVARRQEPREGTAGGHSWHRGVPRPRRAVPTPGHGAEDGVPPPLSLSRSRGVGGSVPAAPILPCPPPTHRGAGPSACLRPEAGPRHSGGCGHAGSGSLAARRRSPAWAESEARGVAKERPGPSRGSLHVGGPAAAASRGSHPARQRHRGGSSSPSPRRAFPEQRTHPPRCPHPGKAMPGRRVRS
ncbi:uncharacterized protein ACIBXB_008296 [Morphnus guianensis]